MGKKIFSACTVRELQKIAEDATGLPPAKQRLVAHGREILASKSTLLRDLGLQDPHETIVCMRRLDEVCQEWCATGRCAVGDRCRFRRSHVIETSPRYVLHLLKSSQWGQHEHQPIQGPNSSSPK